MTTAPTPSLSRVELPQGTITYRTAGPAESTEPPVVFVHGLLVNSLLWAGVADCLGSQGIRCYAPDWPLGSHSVPMNADADLTPRGIARLVLDLLEALDLRDVTLVGNDTGGAICQFVIDTDSSRIGRLVLTNCDAFDQFPPKPFGLLVAAAKHPRLVKALMATMRPAALRHSALGFGPLLNEKPDAAVTMSWVEPSITNPDIRRDLAKLARGIRPAELLDVSTRLHQFGKPVRLVWGDKDRFFKISFAEQLTALFPDAELTRIPGGRTFVPLEEPELVARAIMASHPSTRAALEPGGDN